MYAPSKTEHTRSHLGRPPAARLPGIQVEMPAYSMSGPVLVDPAVSLRPTAKAGQPCRGAPVCRQGTAGVAAGDGGAKGGQQDGADSQRAIFAGNTGRGIGGAQALGEVGGERPAPSSLTLAVIPAKSDPIQLSRTLDILNLRGTNVGLFEKYFGVVVQEFMYGSDVWRGMRRHLREYRARGGRGSPAHFDGPFAPGWFRAPEPFGQLAARKSTEEHGSSVYMYPAIIAIGPRDQWGEFVPMWCQHILHIRSRVWYVHVSRIVFVQNGERYMNWQLDDPLALP